ncbi:MAG: UDP-3-O-(3-hydroxymyristoyl)glucosamine N-acyltransferase [Acidobacteriota bacterium]
MPLQLSRVTVAALARTLGAPFTGNGDAMIEGAGSLEQAEVGELSYVDNSRHFQKALKSRCSAIIAPAEYGDDSKAVITFQNPRLGFARALAIIYPDQPIAVGIHPTAVIAAGASLGEGVSVGAYSVVCEDCEIGARTQIAEHVTIMRGARIGERCLIYPGVRIYHDVEIGRECILHSGAVIGSDGLGFVLTDAGYEKFPQKGSVVLEDQVEIGANTTIDRGAIENTVIGRGTKLDNLIHIAHNCILGESCVFAAQTGVAGSTVIGNRVTVGGQVGVADHCVIEDGATIGAQAGIPTGKRIRAKTMVWGTPARPMEEFREQYRHILSLGSLRATVEGLAKKLEELESLARSLESK